MRRTGHCSSVEETLNAMLDAEADRLCGAKRYERSPERVDTRAGHYERQFHTQAGEVKSFSLSREKYNLKLNWNYIGRQRRGPVSGRSIETYTYTWGARRLLVEATAEYMLTRRFAVFANLRNLNDPAFDTEVAGPSTPPHARLTNRVKYDALWTLGVKGAF